MKITAAILLLACLQISARGLSQQVTLSVKDAPVKQVFKEISRQTGFSVFCDEQLLAGTRPVTMQVSGATVQQALSSCLAGQGLQYHIVNNTIFIERRVTPSTFFSPAPPVVVHDIRIHITDSLGSPLQGASVVVRGTRQGGQTDAEGNITLAGLTGNETLVISYVGYETQEMTVGNNTALSVVLKASPSPLDEIQMMAYGSTTRRLSIGNISTVKAADIEKSPVSNVLQAIQGRVPGIFIEQATGIPGSGMTVRIQGQNSIRNGNEPFYVIDGVPYSAQMLPSLSNIQGGGNPLNYINPQDIESIDILKDADATAIYGSRAANGAILITTRKGKAGKTRVNFNLQSGFGQVAEKLDMLSTQQYLEMRKEAYMNDGLPIPDNTTTPASSNYDLTVWDQNRYTDWQKVLLGGKAKYTDAQVSASGGNDNTQFLLGVNYHKETTVFPVDFPDNKGSVFFNLDNTSDNKRFKMQFSGSYMTDQTNFLNYDLTNNALGLSPNAPALFDADGDLNWEQLPNGNSTWTNPLNLTRTRYNNKTNNLVTNAVVGYEIIRGLILKSSFGYNRLESDETTIVPENYFSPEIQKIYNGRSASYSNKKTSSWTIEPQLTYQLSKNYGQFDFLLGSTFQQTSNNMMAFYGSGYTNDAQLENIKAASVITVANSLQSVYNYNALFGRINYNFKDRYLINLSSRRDGSSRFGSENLFHNFYAVGTGWIFSSENWMKSKLPFLSFGKLKFSYGTTGNDQIGDYAFMSLYDIKGVDIAYGGGSGLVPSGFSNPYLQWEETRKTNIGLDLGFIKDRISINLNYYLNRSSNQLSIYALPIITGFDAISQNLPATVQNSGFEGVLNTVNIQSENFKWTSSFNLTLNRNKLIKYPGMESSSYSYGLIIGKPLGIIKVYEYSGVDPETGTYQFIKADGTLSGTPVAPVDQTVVIDYRTPRYYGGFQNSISFKGFSLDILFQFVKQMGLDEFRFLGSGFPGTFGANWGNQDTRILDRWQKPGDISNIQRFSTAYDYYTQAYNAQNSDAAYVDASYIRLKNLSLSWKFPFEWCNCLHIQNARVYIQGQNLFTITDYPGLDPETKTNKVLPPLRVITFGLQVGL